MENPEVSVRFGLMLEAYCRGAPTHMKSLQRQVWELLLMTIMMMMMMMIMAITIQMTITIMAMMMTIITTRGQRQRCQ